MSKIIVFHESPGIHLSSKEIIHGYLLTKEAIDRGDEFINTSQMTFLCFDLIRKGYRLIVAFDQECKYPFVEFEVGCQINLKEMREAHNLFKMYSSGAMYRSMDKFDPHLMFRNISDAINRKYDKREGSI